MAGFTTFLQQELLDHIGGNGAYTAPTPYVGLYTAAPSDAGGGTEVTGRQLCACQRQHVIWRGIGARVCRMTWRSPSPPPRRRGGTVTHFGVFDASTAGNLLYWGCVVGVEGPWAAGTRRLSLSVNWT
jgi:hypothetical protein